MGSRIAERFDGLRTRVRQTGPRHVCHGRRSRSGDVRRDPEGARSRRRRRDRSRCAVLGSAGGRPGDSAGDRTRAGRRQQPARKPRAGGTDPPVVCGADRDVQLREPDAPDGRRRVRAPGGRRRRRRRARPRSADRRSGRVSRNAGGAGARYDIPVEPDHHRRAHPHGGRARAGIPLRDFTAWRDRGPGSGRRRAPRRWSGEFARTRRCQSR